MDPIVLAYASFPILLVLIFLRVPIGLAMLVVGLAGSWQVYGSAAPLLNQMKTLAYSQFSSHSLSIVPLFLLMGQFATLGGCPSRCSRPPRPSRHLPRRRRDGRVGACAGFGAICGSSLATRGDDGPGRAARAQTRRLRRQPQPRARSPPAARWSILIPPSIVLVIYAILAEQNIAKLFAAAFVPGIPGRDRLRGRRQHRRAHQPQARRQHGADALEPSGCARWAPSGR